MFHFAACTVNCTSGKQHFFFFFKRIDRNAVSSNFIGAIFPKAFVHFMSVSHFGNSHNTSNFIIIMFVTMICDE